MKLYEITELEKKMEIEEDEEIKNTLQEMVKMELQEKAANIVKVIKNKESDIEAIDIEIKRLQAIKKQQESKMQQFKEYVLYNMQEMNLDKVQTPLGNISIRKSTAIQIDESKLPESAFIIERKPKGKTELKEMGLTEEQGVEKITNYSLQIR